MATDKAIKIESAIADRDFLLADSLLSNIYFSLMIKRGDWWIAPEFGSLFHTLRTFEKNVLQQAERFAKSATKWIIDTGRASKIDFFVRRSIQNQDRLEIHVLATKKDGSEVKFETFYSVV